MVGLFQAVISLVTGLFRAKAGCAVATGSDTNRPAPVILICEGLDPLPFPSYIGDMNDELQKRRSMWSWGISASIIAHAVVAFVVLVGIPLELPKPESEQTVSVEIVPPPEEEVPQEEAKPEQAEPEAMKPEEKPAEPPPPPPQEEKVEEGQQQPPPPPPPPQEPPPPEEQAGKQPPPPPPPQTEEPQVETQPEPAPALPSKDNASDRQPLASLRPVFQFGEKDTGPKQATDGDASLEGEAAEKPVDTAPSDTVTPEDTQENVSGNPDEGGRTDGPDEPVKGTEQGAVTEAADSEKPPGAPVVDGVALPDVGLGEVWPDGEGSSVAAGHEDAMNAEITADRAADRPGKSGDPSADGKSGAKSNPPALKEAKRLFSASATGGDLAMTAMGNMPRDVRGAQLCSSELREQLRRGSPAYAPDIVPGPRLGQGTVIDVQAVGFRAHDKWFNVSYRCEVDSKVSKVVSFALRVGGAVPRSDWRKRGFPEY